MVETGDHYRDADGAIYRVVGTVEDVALLRVTDVDGRRVTSGDLRYGTVATLDASFEPARNPDAGLVPVQAVRNLLSGLYWSVRQLL